ncbi:sensor histidine kinase [Leifsonia poae]|uniref:sensor histidine kinase n=1 Tax=Leifsonia poae TaxID=110933 RepID=UPI003D67C8ED
MSPKPPSNDVEGEVRVVEELVRRLAEQGSALTADPTVVTQLRSQVHTILRRTFERLGHPQEARKDPASGSAVGRARARQNIHPADSLAAATLLFDIALGELQAELADHDPADVARALNASIMEQVVPASLSYVDILLERLAVAHSEERLGISRELHDRVAHSIAAGIQRIQLSRQPANSAHDRITEALGLLESALDETRFLALDLRHSVGDKHLDEAIADYVADLGADPPVVEARSEGDRATLQTGVQEEAFVIVREAIHNARRHSRAERIRVTSIWTPNRLTIAIADDGTGFERDTIRPGALGLIAAQERAELIGADLAIETRPGTGTTVTLTIALKGERE